MRKQSECVCIEYVQFSTANIDYRTDFEEISRSWEVHKIVKYHRNISVAVANKRRKKRRKKIARLMEWVWELWKDNPVLKAVFMMMHTKHDTHSVTFW